MVRRATCIRSKWLHTFSASVKELLDKMEKVKQIGVVASILRPFVSAFLRGGDVSPFTACKSGLIRRMMDTKPAAEEG